jgi:hypothetical protein
MCVKLEVLRPLIESRVSEFAIVKTERTPEVEEVDRERAAQFLASCSDHDLIWVLERALKARQLGLEGGDWVQQRLCLAVASRELSEEASEPAGAAWGPWELEIVNYVDHEEYEGEYIGDPFCQEGACANCGIPAVGQAKRSVCAVCGSETALT